MKNEMSRKNAGQLQIIMSSLDREIKALDKLKSLLNPDVQHECESAMDDIANAVDSLRMAWEEEAQV